MATEAVQPMAVPKTSFIRRALAIGPGLVFILGAIGPRDLVTNSMAGSLHGYGLLWMLVVSLFARYVILDATARYVMVTGESLLAGCGRVGRWVVLLWFIVAVLKRHLATLVRIVLLGTAAHFVLPLPTSHSVAIWGIASWTAGFALMYWGRYATVERFCKPLTLVLGASLATAAILSRPDLLALAKGAVTPSFPEHEGVYSTAILLMALLSGATGSFSNLKYAAYIHDKGWRTLAFLKDQRIDLGLSMAGMFVMLALIQAAAVGALQPHGIEIKKLEDLIPIFAGILGSSGQIILGVSLWCIVFGSYLSSGTAYGIMVSDVYYRFIKSSTPGAAQAAEPAPSSMPTYRWWLIYIFVSPFYVFFTDWTPIGLILLQGAASVVTLPLIIFAVLRLTTEKKVMGNHVNGWPTNTILVLTCVGAVYLAVNGAYEYLTQSG